MLVVDVTRSEVGSLSRQLRLRPLTGADELSLTSDDSTAAVALLERLAPDSALAERSISEIDRGLAQLYQTLYGPQAECSAVCGSCGEVYEFTLDLADIVAAQDAERSEIPDVDGVWTLPDGRRLRAPRLDDLAKGGDELLDRVMVEGTADPGLEEVGEFLELVAPILTLDFDTACPHCATTGPVRFDLAVYVARRLRGERQFLLREMHLIASRYGWSRDEILGLERDDRRSFAQMIEGDGASQPRRWSS